MHCSYVFSSKILRKDLVEFMTQKKESIFSRVKNWWAGLCREDKEAIKIAAVYFADGCIISGFATHAISKHGEKKKLEEARMMGFQDGRTEAFREIIDDKYIYKRPRNGVEVTRMPANYYNKKF